MIGVIKRGNGRIARERVVVDSRLNSGRGAGGQFVIRRVDERFRWRDNKRHTRGGIPRLVREIRKKPAASQYVYISQSYTGVSEQCPAPSPAP